MADWNLPRHPASALLLTNLGAEHGVPVEVSLRGTRLTMAGLSDPSVSVSAAQELRIVRNLVAAVDDPAELSVEAGMRYHLTTHGIWGFAMSSSANVRAAVSIGLRYVDLTFAFCKISIVGAGDKLRLTFDPTGLPSDARRFLVERELASIVNIGRQIMSDPAMPISVHFAYPAPPSLQPYQKFGAGLTFGAPGNYVEVDADLLDQPLPQADAYTAAATEAQCRQLLDNKRARSGFAGKVRDRLISQPTDMPDIETIAADLHLSSRTLRRHLDAEGTSYRALADEVRQRLAEELLSTKAVTVAEVGRRLGYADTPSFTAAFKRWNHGVPPSRYTATLSL